MPSLCGQWPQTKRGQSLARTILTSNVLRYPPFSSANVANMCIASKIRKPVAAVDIPMPLPLVDIGDLANMVTSMSISMSWRDRDECIYGSLISWISQWPWSLIVSHLHLKILIISKYLMKIYTSLPGQVHQDL